MKEKINLNEYIDILNSNSNYKTQEQRGYLLYRLTSLVDGNKDEIKSMGRFNVVEFCLTKNLFKKLIEYYNKNFLNPEIIEEEYCTTTILNLKYDNLLFEFKYIENFEKTFLLTPLEKIENGKTIVDFKRFLKEENQENINENRVKELNKEIERILKYYQVDREFLIDIIKI